MNKLVIFGCDGTLIDSEILTCKVVPDIWSTYGVHLTEEEFVENIIGRSYNSQYLEEILKQLPENINEITAKALSLVFDEKLQMVQGMRALLDHLMSQFCIISNKSLAYTKRALDITQIKNCFDPAVYSTNFIENCKPKINTYELAVQNSKVIKSNCIAVEASPCCIRAAKLAGVKVVGFAGASHFNNNLKNKLIDEMPDYFCEDVSELYEVLLDEF